LIFDQLKDKSIIFYKAINNDELAKSLLNLSFRMKRETCKTCMMKRQEFYLACGLIERTFLSNFTFYKAFKQTLIKNH